MSKYPSYERGTLVSVNSHPNSTVYVVGPQHAQNKFLYELTYNTMIGEVSAGWMDVSLFQMPTTAQLNADRNRWTVAG